MSNGARQAAEDEDKEDQCPICLADLPDTGRGVLTCVSSLHFIYSMFQGWLVRGPV